MTPSHDLFNLIKSLKQSEKRYFKLYASRLSEGKAPEYMQLYKVIEVMPMYDEIRIREHFKGKIFLKQLHVAKNYLTNIILQALAAYYYDSSAHNSLTLLLQTIEILYDKDQHQLCFKQIEKGIRLCKKYSKHNFLFIFLDWQSRLLLRKQEYDKALKIIKEQKDILNTLQQYLKAKERALKIHHRLITKGFPRTTEHVNSLKTEMIELRKEHQGVNASTEEQYYTLFALSNFYAESGEQKKRAETMKKLVFILEKNMAYSLEHPHFYLSALNNYYNALINSGEINLAKEILQKIRSLSQKLNPKKHDSRNYALLVSYDIELEIAILTNQTQKALQHASAIEQLIDKNEGVFQKSTTLELIFNTARVFFIAGKYLDTLDWVNRILNEKMSKVREDLNTASRILYLLIHYELGNKILLDSIITSTKNSLKYKRRLFKSEQTIITFMSKLNAAKTEQEKLLVLAKLSIAIKNSVDDPHESTPGILFDLSAWVKSKLTGKPMGEIIANNYVLEIAK